MQDLTRELYERDPAAYLAEFEDYLRGWEGSDEERDLAAWLTVGAVGSDDESIFRFIALGYIAATWESWTDEIAEHRLGSFENMRQKSDRECAERGIPEELYDLVYGSNLMSVQIGELARPVDASLIERLDLIFEQVVVKNTTFEEPPDEKTLLGLRTFFDLGIGLYLFLRWWEANDDRGVPYDERWNDIGLVQVHEDRLGGLDLPMTIRGCTIDQTDMLGYEIRSPGKFGGEQLTAFLAEGDVANIVQLVTSGRLGTRTVKVPEPTHIDVLRDLGFQQAVFPNGQRYRLSSWGGLSGIRKIRD